MGPETCKSYEPKISELPPGMKPDHFLDLTSVVCPINYVKTKLKLEEEVKRDEILEIVLDRGMPIKSVPPSVEKDGHEILAITEQENQFHVFIKKKGD